MRFNRTAEAPTPEGTPRTSRTSRRTERFARRRTPRMLIAVLAVAGIALVVAGGFAIARSRSAAPTPVAEKLPTATQTVSMPSTASAAAASRVEIPSLVGLGVDEARLILESAGLEVVVREAGQAVSAGVKPVVVSQDPVAGTVSEEGDTVRLVVPPASAESTAAALAAKKPAGDFVVCIDPGHQARANSTPEPIGPGSKTTKPSVSGGATGVSTDIPEYELTLQISVNLKKRLEAQGIKVVMTRTVNDVDISNSQRAAIANKAGADLFVRIHCDGSPKASTVGISTLYPAVNSWTKPIAPESKRAAQIVQKALIATTGAVDRGAIQRTDLSGFNWAKVPSVLIEAGFLSNTVEDKLLSSPHYQDKIAQGIANGILTYSNGR